MGADVIVAVDDDPDVLVILSRILHDFEVLTFTDPLSALQALEASSATLLVSDFKMYSLRGDEFLRRAWQIAPSLRKRSLLCSGSLEASEFAAVMGIEFLTKPFDSKALRRRVDMMLATQQLDTGATTSVRPCSGRTMPDVE